MTTKAKPILFSGEMVRANPPVWVYEFEQVTG